jgi:nucleotide-binding universal stress UspA family protein
MIALKHILVATDFSECSDAAVEQGRALAAAFDASLHLLHIVTAPLHEVWACYAPGAEFLTVVRDLEVEARRRLEELAASGDLRRDRVVVQTAWGDPSDEILQYAREHQVDLIVCGTHGRRGWDHVVMGSVAERVVRLAPCPVLTAHASPALAMQVITLGAEALAAG